MAKKDEAIGVAFEWVAAPDDLSAHVNSLYILRVGDHDIEEMMPAYSGQLCLLLKGGATMTFCDGRQGEALPAYLLTPMTCAQKFHIEAGTVMVGVSLNVRGWACFTDLPADEVKDSYFPVEDVLPESVADALLSIPDDVKGGAMTERQALDALASVVRNNLTTLSARHEQVIDETLKWLSSSFKPPISDLMEALPYSERQVQRLVARFFAQTPVRLIRRFRAIRAATLLTMDGLEEKLEDEIRDAFYDQAHMIKEIRYFTGKTPRRLNPATDSVVRETLGEPGYGAVDLFGGTQDAALGRTPQ